MFLLNILYKKYHAVLFASTALAAVFVSFSKIADAADVTITTATTTQHTMASGETLTVTDTGSIITPTITSVHIPVGVIAGQLSNSGIINSASLTGVRIEANGDLAGGIVNTGTIYGRYNGIYTIHTGADISGGIVNNGTVSSGSSGIYNYKSDISGGIVNNGLIKAGNSGLGGYQGNVGKLTNAGTISAVGTGVWLMNGYYSGGIINSGLIKGGYGGIWLGRYGNGGAPAGIINESSGTIDGGVKPAIFFKTLGVVSPIIINGGRIIGDVTDTLPSAGFSPVTIGGDFKTEGNFTVTSVTVNAAKTLEISSGNTFTVEHMNTSTDGTIAFEVSSHNPGGTGKLDVVGAGKGIDLTGMSITADVADAPTLTRGDKLQVGTGVTAITGGTGATPKPIADNSPLWAFSMVDGTYAGIGGNNTQLYFLVDFQPATRGNASADTVLKSLGTPTDPTLAQVVSNYNAATTYDAFNAVLASVQPDVAGISYQASQDVLNTSLDLVEHWLDGISKRWEQNGLSSGNALISTDTDLQGWAQAFGGYATQGTRDNIAGYRASTGGIIIGVDTGEHSKKGKAGVAFSYAHTAATSHSVNHTQAGIDSYQLTGYGELKLSPTSFVHGMLAYGRANTETVRHDVGGVSGLNAHGTFGSDQYTARVVAGRGFLMSHDLTLTPQVSASWTHYVPQDYTETGAGGANLHVAQKSLNTAELGVGVDALWHFQQSNGAIITPELQLGYSYDLLSDNLETVSTFAGGGTAFTSPGPTPAHNRFNFSPQISWRATAGWSATLGYSLNYRQSYAEQSTFLRVETNF